MRVVPGVFLLFFVFLSQASHCTSQTMGASAWSSCALDSNSEAVCWGRPAGKDGMTGAPEGVRFNMINCGHIRCCGVTVDQELKCWGTNTDAKNIDLVTNLVPSGTNWKSVDVGVDVVCAIRTDNTFTCWSHDAGDVAGMPTGKVRAVAASHSAACAITLEGGIRCWGVHHSHNTDISKDGDYIAIQMGHQTGMALAADGSVFMWGKDTHGPISTKPADLGKVKAISHHYYSPCVILEDDSLKCWGLKGHDIPSGIKVKQVVSDYSICWMTLMDEITCLARGDNAEGEANVPANIKWYGLVNCGPKFLLVGTGLCPGIKTTGDVVEVHDIYGCRSNCNIYFHETYFSVWDEGDKIKCRCSSDCDYRTDTEDGTKYTTYEILSDTVENLLAANELSILTLDKTLKVKTDELTRATKERDLWEKRFLRVEAIDQTREEHASYKARAENPSEEDEEIEEEGVGCGMIQGNNGSSFTEKVSYVLIGSVMGTVVMFLAMNKQKIVDEEGQFLLEA